MLKIIQDLWLQAPVAIDTRMEAYIIEEKLGCDLRTIYLALAGLVRMKKITLTTIIPKQKTIINA